MQKLETALRILYFTLFLGKRYAVRYSLSVLAAGGGGAGQPQLPVSHATLRINHQ